MDGIVDGDSHFMEPLDLFEQNVEARFRDRAVKIATDPVTHRRAMVVDGKPMRLRDVEEVLAILSGYGQKEEGGTISTFDRYSVYSTEWQDMTARIRFLDTEGFASQIIYPTLGIIWEGELSDPELAAAPVELITAGPSIRSRASSTALSGGAYFDSGTCARGAELQRVAKLGCHTLSLPRCLSRVRASATPIMTRCGRQRRTSTFPSACTWCHITTIWAASFIVSPSQD